MVMADPLLWIETQHGLEVILGDFSAGNGVRFNLLHMATCYRRGPWRLLIEVEDYQRLWGCFDDQDQPMRWYHSKERAQDEAQAIADVLVADHAKKEILRGEP